MSEYHDENERDSRDFEVFVQASNRTDPNGWMTDLIDHAKARFNEIELGQMREVDFWSNDNDYLYRDPEYREAIGDMETKLEAALDAMIRLIESDRVVRERAEAIESSVRDMFTDANNTLESDTMMAIDLDVTDHKTEE